MQHESFAVLKEEVASSVNKLVNSFLQSKEYSQDEVQQWTASLSEEIVKTLKGMSSNFKFCVSCMILQKGDAGMHISTTCYWDSNQDGSVAIKCENNSMYCIVNIFGIAF
jgi:dynein light chain Tctex-type 1